jgi:hypothetical protein
MPFNPGTIRSIISLAAIFLLALPACAESASGGGNAGTVRGAVTDPSGAVIPGATVHLANQVSGLDQTAVTDATGQFIFANIPFNPYKVDVSANGFAPLSQSFEIRSVVGVNLNLVLQVMGADSTVTVEASGDLVETDSTFHTDVNREQSRWRANPPDSARWLRSPHPASRPTPTASFMGLATMHPTHFRLMASRSPISKARSSPTRFLLTRFSLSKSSAAHRQPNTAAKPAW